MQYFLSLTNDDCFHTSLVLFIQQSFFLRADLPQPDNRAAGENPPHPEVWLVSILFTIFQFFPQVCLGILNNFYADGIKWHDVAWWVLCLFLGVINYRYGSVSICELIFSFQPPQEADSVWAEELDPINIGKGLDCFLLSKPFCPSIIYSLKLNKCFSCFFCQEKIHSNGMFNFFGSFLALYGVIGHIP